MEISGSLNFEDLRLNYEKGKIATKELTYEQMNMLSDYYREEIEFNRREIEETKRKIEEMRRKIENIV